MTSGSHANGSMWIYVIIGCILLVTCGVAVVRKCLQRRRLDPTTRNNGGNFRYDNNNNVKKNDINESNMINVGRNVNESAEYTPLIHTGPAI